METWLLLIVMSLAVYRLTRLLVKDTFPPVLWLRDKLVGEWRPLTAAEWRFVRNAEQVVGKESLKHAPMPFVMRDVDHGDGPEASRWVDRARWVPDWLSELISCPWCASGWVALGVTGGVWATVGLPVPLLVWPAVWAAGALLAAQEWA
jgi:hypothetical protein